MFTAYSVAERIKNPSPSAAEFTAEQALMWLREWAFYECVKGRTKCQEKIAVITARADDHTQKDIICGIAEAAFAADTDVVVFSNIYNHRIRDEFLNFENIIYDFFDPSGFDGVIVKRFWTFPPQNLAERSARLLFYVFRQNRYLSISFC